MSAAPDVLIVGGGIWGLSTAFHLARTGACRVRLVERNSDFAQETTINAAGQVGQIRSSPAVTRAIAYALDLFESFPQAYGYDAGLHRCGSLFLGLTPERLQYFEKQIALGRANGLTVDVVPPAEMKRFVPGLATSAILGGYFVHGDGYLDSSLAARALANAARDGGADLRAGIRVDACRVEDGRVTGVETSVGFMAAGTVVLAAGPWTTALARPLGFELASQPIRHQRVRTERVTDLPAGHPVLRVPDRSCYIRPDRDALVYGHFEADPEAFDTENLPREFRSSDIEPPIAVMAAARDQLASVYPILATLDVAEHRRGLITFSPDGGYVLGPVPGLPNLFVAGGCAALGIAGSAAIGRWLTEWIVKGSPSRDAAEFSIDRFDSVDVNRAARRELARQAYAGYYAIKS